MTKEDDELKRLGLPVPEDTSNLTEEEMLEISTRKKKNIPKLPKLVKREAKNEDLPPDMITPEELRKRANEQQEREEKLRLHREQLVLDDREFLSTKWKSLIPEAFSHTDVSSLPEELSNLSTEWLLLPPAQKRNILIYGAPGRGKTFTAYAIAKELFINRQKVFMAEAPELLSSLRPNAIEPLSLEKIKKTHYLMIDDLGTEKDSEWVQEIWFKIFDYRWKHRLPMIVTMNLELSELIERYGERSASRIMDNALFVEIIGDNRRS